VTSQRRASLALATAALLATACRSSGEPTERVVIPAGATFSAVADTLAAHHLIGSKGWFKFLGRVRRVDRSVQAGVYDIPTQASAWHVLTTLARGRVVLARFTVPEGLSVVEFADLARNQLGIPAESLVVAAGDTALTRKLGIPRPDLEGYLLPETYKLPGVVSARELVGMMVAEFEDRWDPAWQAQLDSLSLSRDQVVTLASIVEGEARHDDERPIIAGVYLNRLRIGMALQADPTVQYAIFLATGKRKPRLYTRDYQFRSPYNTYLHPGLPPGPVNSPSLRSIEASLHPAKVPYLYFVAGPDGRHVFSRSYDEHLRAIARVRRGR